MELLQPPSSESYRVQRTVESLDEYITAVEEYFNARIVWPREGMELPLKIRIRQFLVDPYGIFKKYWNKQLEHELEGLKIKKDELKTLTYLKALSTRWHQRIDDSMILFMPGSSSPVAFAKENSDLMPLEFWFSPDQERELIHPPVEYKKALPEVATLSGLPIPEEDIKAKIDAWIEENKREV